MKQTRFMQVMFSAVERGDEELAAQVRDDIEGAKENGVVETDEVTYANLGDGKVMIIDNENGEATIAEMSPEEADTYDLVAVPTEELEKFLHPMECGHPNPEVVTEEYEDVSEDHLDGTAISDSMEDIPAEEAAEGEFDDEEDEEEERTFSVSTDNTAVLRIFSDQEFCERLFSEVIESEDTATVGNIKVEKCDDEDNTVIITDLSTGDQAKVEIDNEEGELEVTELSQKEFKTFSQDDAEEVNEEGEEEIEDDSVQDFDPLFVVGIDPVNHIIVDSPVYYEEDAETLAQRLSEIGVVGVQIFDNPDEARAHAFELLSTVGVDVDDEESVDEPVEKEFSDCSVYLTKYYSDYTTYMLRLFSEAEEGESESQDVIEDAIENGEQIENDDEIITPIDNKTAVIEDKENGEFTKAVLDEDEIEISKISEEEADELLKDLEVEEDDDEENEEEEEKTFSEEISRYQLRLFSDIADQEDLEEALETGKTVETEDEIINPVDENILVVEDKKTGELTKVTVDGDDFDTEKISEDEVEDLIGEDEENENDVEDNNENDDEDNEEKKFSDTLSKFFADVNASQQPVAPVAQPAAPAVDPNAAPVADPNAQPAQAPAANSVEAIEDKALQAVTAIQEAALTAQQEILAAKEAPVQAPEGDLREATFSDTSCGDDILGSWLSRI